jgi:hypothetical protein
MRADDEKLPRPCAAASGNRLLAIFLAGAESLRSGHRVKGSLRPGSAGQTPAGHASTRDAAAVSLLRALQRQQEEERKKTAR